MASSDAVLTLKPCKRRLKLTLRGSLDLGSALELHRLALEAAGAGSDVELDWRGAGHLSAAVIQVLLALESALAGRGRSLRIGPPGPQIKQELDRSGLSGWISRDSGDPHNSQVV